MRKLPMIIGIVWVFFSLIIGLLVVTWPKSSIKSINNTTRMQEINNQNQGQGNDGEVKSTVSIVGTSVGGSEGFNSTTSSVTIER